MHGVLGKPDGNIGRRSTEPGSAPALLGKLEGLKKKYPALIKEIRGKGLLAGAELVRPGREVVDLCLAEGAIINCTAGNVLRFVPPLDIQPKHVDEVVAILDGVLEKWQ